jgi:hypothetical protein
MDDTFFGTKSTELRVTGDLQIEGLEVGDDGVERAAFYVGGKVFESTDDEVCAAAEGKGEARIGEAASGFEDAVGGRIIGTLTVSEPMSSREVGKRRSMTRTLLMVTGATRTLP